MIRAKKIQFVYWKLNLRPKNCLLEIKACNLEVDFIYGEHSRCANLYDSGWSAERWKMEFTFELISNILPNFCRHASFKILGVHIFLICWKMKTEETLTNFLKSAQYLSARLLQTLRCAHLSDLLKDEKWQDVDQVVKFCWSVQRKKTPMSYVVPDATTRDPIWVGRAYSYYMVHKNSLLQCILTKIGMWNATELKVGQKNGT